jgi:hypothetical protein
MPRFDIDMMGRVIESCECGYRGSQRGTTDIVHISIPEVLTPQSVKFCKGCCKNKTYASFYSRNAICKSCSLKQARVKGNARRESERDRVLARAELREKMHHGLSGGAAPAARLVSAPQTENRPSVEAGAAIETDAARTCLGSRYVTAKGRD